MKIGIMGSRGIPNHYGGFEQFAEQLAKRLVGFGFDVTVYNSSRHQYKADNYDGIKIVHKFDPEKIMGSASQIIYDLLSIIDSRKQNYDILLKLGYGTNFLWQKFIPSDSIVVSHLDGLEWARSKYNKFVSKILRYGEKVAVSNGDTLISDSLAIQSYLKRKYNKDSVYIPYGADIFDNPSKSILKNYSIKPYQYDLVIARFVPENNIDLICKAKTISNFKRKLVVVGNYENQFGHWLKKKFSNSEIIFTGAIYDLNQLNNLRFFSNLYIHGHSVGGTNPSLLEAMACHALIIAHDNSFNRSILNENCYYFKNITELARLFSILKTDPDLKGAIKIAQNIEKIKTHFAWERITKDYVTLFNNLLSR